jgi:enoyl-CoA hydratase
MSRKILVERDGTIATVILNRAEKMNALSKEMWAMLGETMLSLSADNSLRCIVLRGAGDQAFCPGNDISEFASERHDGKSAQAYGHIMRRTIDALASCKHPVVAMIQGVCVGGGLELAALCDMRICGQSSRFGVPINKLGLVMSYDELSGLVNLVGRAKTMELLLEGQIYSADEAYAMGLVQRVVDDSKVTESAYECALRIASGAPLVARWHKKFISRLEKPKAISSEERKECFACFDTSDFQEGYKAFLAKQRPYFRGR